MVYRDDKHFRSYLQLYPFSKLSSREWEIVQSEEFFERYIEDGALFMSSITNESIRVYLEAKGLGFRVAYLLHPVLFLYLQCCGLAVLEKYVPCDTPNRIVYYGGSLADAKLHYWSYYKRFIEEVGICSKRYDYCVKTDIKNFYGSIDIDMLIEMISVRSNGTLSAIDTEMLSSMLKYIGRGSYPLIERSPASYYLATCIYLDEVDHSLSNMLLKNTQVSSYMLVRYIDDLYVFFSADNTSRNGIASAIIRHYANSLSGLGLALNAEKTQLTTGEQAVENLNNGYDDDPGPQSDAGFDLPAGTIASFFSEVCQYLEKGLLSLDIYNDVLASSFKCESISSKPDALYRECCYHHQSMFKSNDAKAAIGKAFSLTSELLLYDASRTIEAAINTGDETIIKGLLNSLFRLSRGEGWTAYEIIAATIYLRKRNFHHNDLMSELKKHRPDLHSFFVRAYQRSFMSSLCDEDGENLIDTCTGDAWTKFQYLMYLRCSSERAYLEESQYYQAFFDRVTSLLRKARKGRTSWVGDKKKLKEEYIAYPEANAIINRAFDLRNSSPLVHASSQALDSPALIVDFQQSVRCLKGLLSKRLRYGENGESAE